MSARIALAVWILAAGVGSGWTSPGGTDDPKKEGEAKKAEELSVSDLSQEVQALRLLHQFKVTPEQMKALQKLTGETAQKPEERQGKASAEYTQMLRDLRDALIDDNDDERIDDLENQLDELTQTEKPSLDDDIILTPAARRRTPEVLRQLKPAQVAAYLGAIADEVPDPLEKLVDTLDKVRGLKVTEWKDQRDELALDISRLVAGTNKDRLAKTRKEVLDLLGRTRLLSPEEFKKQKPELDKAARKVVGDLAPTDVLRHVVEYSLAELLSNPRLEAVLATRLK